MTDTAPTSDGATPADTPADGPVWEPIRVTNTPRAEAQHSGPPITIDGATTAGDQWEETFTTIGAMPLGLEHVVPNALSVRDGKLFYVRSNVLLCLQTIVAPADTDRWNTMLADPARMVELSTLGDALMAWVGQVANRPTGPRPS